MKSTHVSFTQWPDDIPSRPAEVGVQLNPGAVHELDAQAA